MGIMRRRARRRILVAGAATGAAAYHAGKKHQEREQYDQPPPDEATQYAPAPAQRSGPDSGDLDQIQKLADLHESGALTDEEFAVAKAKLLA